MASEQTFTSVGTSKIMSRVLAFCRTCPLRRVLSCRPGGAGGELVGRDELGPERPGCIEILAHHPLRRLELVVADRSVVEERIPGDVLERAVPRDVASGLADHDDHLALVIELLGDVRPHERYAVGHPRLRKAVEQHRIFRRVLVRRFRGVIDVVQSDGNRLRRIDDRRQVRDTGQGHPRFRARCRCFRGREPLGALAAAVPSTSTEAQPPSGRRAPGPRAGQDRAGRHPV